MITVVFPGQLNWFYEKQATSIADDLCRNDVPAQTVAAQTPSRLGRDPADEVLIVSFAECLAAAQRSGFEQPFLRALGRFKRRILVNFDSVRSPWFLKHFSQGEGYFAEIFDIGLFRQVAAETLFETPYRFIPEAFSADDAKAIVSWSPGRLLPWTVLGHATPERAALIEALLRCMSKNGFVFSPPLRPFTSQSGLDHAGVHRVLTQSDLYIWGSHHHFPYHETQRALHAVACGAVPVKIDPLHSDLMMIPWVYPSLTAFLQARERCGLFGLFETARSFLEGQGSLGRNIKAALGHG